MFPLIFVNPLVLCWAVHLQSATAWLGKSAFAHLAFLHGVSLSFAKRIHPTGMIRLFSPFGKLARCSPFLVLQGYAVGVTDKGINWGKHSWGSHILIKYMPWLPKCLNAAFCGICMWEKEWKCGHLSKAYLRKQKPQQLSTHSRSHRCLYSSWLHPGLLCTLEAQVGASDWTKQYISLIREQKGIG